MNKNIIVDTQAKSRVPSLDILRVLCMFFIVFGHGFTHSNLQLEIFTANYFITEILRAFYIVHVNCFVLISGYFLCEKKVTFQKALSLWGHAVFWSVILYFIFVIFGIETFSIRELVKSILVFTQQRYWFLTTYILMFALVPFINIMISAMTQKQHFAFLTVYFIIYVLLQNVFYWRNFTTVFSYSPLFFIFLYMTAAYVKKYPPIKQRRWILFYVITCLCGCITGFSVTYVTKHIFGSPLGSSVFKAYDSVVVYLGAVFLFMAFITMKKRENILSRIAGMLSPLTFGIYLIHDNAVVRPWLWLKVINPS